MRQRWKNRVPFAAGVGLFVLLIGATVLATKSGNWLGQLISRSQLQKQISAQNPKSAVLPLVSLSPAQRMVQLQAIAQLPQSQDRDRARYVLASDLIEQNKGEEALSTLQGLEQDYPVLAPYIALKRAQAYEVSGDTKAQASWQELLLRYPKQPVAAQALFVLGRTKPKYWEQAIAQFPAHPRTLEIVRSSLKQNPNQPKLLLLLAKYAYDQPGIILVIDQLVLSTIQLKPEDWEAIAFAYWENKVYAKAGAAYAKAPRTPLNVYRTAVGFLRGNKWLEAIAAYQQLLRDFPNAKETGIALMQLAKMAQTKDALNYLDQVINRFPDYSGEALVQKAKILDALHSNKSAESARQLLLTHYSDSDAAAAYRWKAALARAAAKDYQAAYLWASPIPTHNAKSVLAPRAGFWSGKWANQMGRQQNAKAAFEYVLRQFPQSYYAWRSAAILGLDVGNFNTVRQLAPEVMVPPTRSLLPAGSATLKELYQLGQDQDASTLWQVEFHHQMQPTVAQQLTNGLMQLMLGENAKGISTVSALEDQKTPEEQAQYQALSQQPAYWYALYPFPFLKEIETWSQQRQINPLLVIALIRQESRFEPKTHSVVGAVGLMQVMPATGKWVAEKIKLTQYNLENPNDNVQMGTWFLDYADQEYKNNSLLAVASYNAGLSNVAKWLKDLGKSDPDEFVEAIPFGETRNYVRQVFGNYWNYLRLYNPKISQLMASTRARSPKAMPQSEGR